jgi:hypothetical protein
VAEVILFEGVAMPVAIDARPDIMVVATGGELNGGKEQAE